MTGDVTREISAVAIPTGITLRFWLEARTLAVVRHHPIGFEFQKVFRVEILCTLQWTTCYTH